MIRRSTLARAGATGTCLLLVLALLASPVAAHQQQESITLRPTVMADLAKAMLIALDEGEAVSKWGEA